MRYKIIFRNNMTANIPVGISDTIFIRDNNFYFGNRMRSISSKISDIEIIDDRGRRGSSFRIYTMNANRQCRAISTVRPETCEAEYILKFIHLYLRFLFSREYIYDILSGGNRFHGEIRYLDLSLLSNVNSTVDVCCDHLYHGDYNRFKNSFCDILDGITVNSPRLFTVLEERGQQTQQLAIRPDLPILDEELSQQTGRLFDESQLINQPTYITSSQIQQAVNVTHQTNERKVIHNYNYKPEYIKHPDSSSLLLGAEIEIDKGGLDNVFAASRCCSIMNTNEDVEDFIYCMHDGSLTSGFEIATMPCGFEVHKTLPYSAMFQYLVGLGYRAHDTSTCGLHVHVNRSFFGDTNLQQQIGIGNLIYLVGSFEDQVKTIARRSYNRYYHKIGVTKEDTTISAYAKGVSNPSKYASVNTMHKDTIELRMFRGTLNYDTFIATLEFVKVICTVAKETSIYDIETVTWEDVYNRFSDELKEYYNVRLSKSSTRDTAQENGNVTTSIDYSSFQTSSTSQTPNTLAEAIRMVASSLEEHVQTSVEEVVAETCIIPTSEKEFKKEIKKLRKELKKAQRNNNTFAIRQCSQDLQDMQRRYNEYKRIQNRVVA